MPSVIIVEDDPMISEIYQKKFMDSGFRVFTAVSGNQALDFARKEKIDLVLSDLMMSKMNGFELIENLRGGGYDPDIKIIILSNLNETGDRDRALSLGANAFINKSEFSPAELVKEVNRLMNQLEEQKRSEIKTEKSGNGGHARREKIKKILLIEDEEVFLEMFGEKLKQEGFEVVFAQNGAWGVKKALEEEFDLFIIDMIMPAMNGEEIVSRLKLEGKTKNIPIIILSASVEDEAARRVEALGTQAFFIKTQITPGELVKKVNEILK